MPRKKLIEKIKKIARIKPKVEETKVEETLDASENELDDAQAVKIEAPVEPKIEAPVAEAPKVDPDYLRQYQYRKGAVPGSPQSNPQPGSKAERMKAALLTQPKIRMYIELDGRDKSIPLSVTLNGYRLDFPRQNYVDVPEQVANEIANSMKQKNQALDRQNIASGDPGLIAALS